MCGVAVCGRPVSCYLDNGFMLEANRLYTDGTRNACFMLYGAWLPYDDEQAHSTGRLRMMENMQTDDASS